jgi:hypothetical protein
VQSTGESLGHWLRDYDATLTSPLSWIGQIITSNAPPDFGGFYVARVNHEKN